MQEEKLGIGPRIRICCLSCSGGGDAAYITQQQLNLVPVRFHKVQISAACARAGRSVSSSLQGAVFSRGLWGGRQKIGT